MTRTSRTRRWPLLFCILNACAIEQQESPPAAAVEVTAAPGEKVPLCAEDAPTISRVALSWDPSEGALVVESLVDAPIVAEIELTTFDGLDQQRTPLEPVRLGARERTRVDVISRLGAPAAALQLRARVDVFSGDAGAPRLGRTLSDRAQVRGGKIFRLEPGEETVVLDPGGRLTLEDRAALQRTVRSPGVTTEAIIVGPEVSLEAIRATRHVALEGGAR